MLRVDEWLWLFLGACVGGRAQNATLDDDHRQQAACVVLVVLMVGVVRVLLSVCVCGSVCALLIQ